MIGLRVVLDACRPYAANKSPCVNIPVLMLLSQSQDGIQGLILGNEHLALPLFSICADTGGADGSGWQVWPRPACCSQPGK